MDKSARIPILQPDEMTPEQRDVFDAFTRPREAGGPRPKGTPYRLTLHWPAFTEAWHRTGVVLREQGVLPAHLAELVILLTVRHWNCGHAWRSHSAAALSEGLSEATIDAVKEGRRPDFTDADAEAVHDCCVELHERHAIDDATYRRVADRFGPKGVVELVALAGYYTMVAMALNAHSPQPPADGKAAH